MKRVIPRDLFNDANLLKCLGRICLLIHDGKLPLDVEYDDEPYDIRMNPSDGSTFVANLNFQTLKGRCVYFTRGLDARDSWPLLAQDDQGRAVYVFDAQGNVTTHFMDFLNEVSE